MDNSMCILAQDKNLIIVQGRPDVYLENKDFEDILRYPNIAANLSKALGEDKYPNGLLIGRLGKLQNGVYQEAYSAVTIEMFDDQRELNYYEPI